VQLSSLYAAVVHPDDLFKRLKFSPTFARCFAAELPPANKQAASLVVCGLIDVAHKLREPVIPVHWGHL
jgi:hypothetical protein